jgi:hypothetical protein
MILLSPAVEHPGLPHRNGVNGRRYADFPTLRRKRQAFAWPSRDGTADEWQRL